MGNKDIKGVYRSVQSFRKTLLFENTRRALKNPVAFLGELAQLRIPVVGVRVAGKKYLVVQHPDYIKHIFSDNYEAFTKFGITRIMRIFLGEGLVTSNDETWFWKRRLIQPVFQKEALKGFEQVVHLETQDFIQKLKSKPPDVPININQELLELNLSIVFKALLGTPLDDKRDKMLGILEELNAFASKWIKSPIKIPLNWPTKDNNAFLDYCRRFDNIIYQVIEDRRNRQLNPSNPIPHDLLDTLLAYKDEDTGKGMSDRQLRDEITTMIMASHDTTSQTLSWILYEITRNPQIHDRLKEEAESCLGLGLAALKDLSHLSFTNQVVKEGLRHYPAFSTVIRKPRTNMDFMGVPLKPTSNVLINIYGMHHHPDYWEHPDRFEPERFGEGTEKDRPNYAYIPFGAGPRYCIGRNLSNMVMQVVLSGLVRHFRFKVPDGYIPEIEPNHTLKAKGGIPLIIQQA